MFHWSESPQSDESPDRWPEHPPKDFHLRMLDVLSYRAVTPADLWDEVRGWLDDNRVPVTAGVCAAECLSRPVAELAATRAGGHGGC